MRAGDGRASGGVSASGGGWGEVSEVWDQRCAGTEVLYGLWRGDCGRAGCRGSCDAAETGRGWSEVSEVRNQRCAGFEILHGLWRGDCGRAGSRGSCDSAEAGRCAYTSGASGGGGWEMPEMRSGDTGWLEVL